MSAPNSSGAGDQPVVTVIGDALLDVLVTPAAAMRHRGDVPASVSLGPGGQGANIAVRMARRGVRTRLVCRLGDDVAGTLVREALVGDGVELIDLGAASTGAVVVLMEEDGDRTMLSQRVPLLDAGGALPTAAIDTEWLVISGYALLEPADGISASGPLPRRVVAGCSLDPGQADRWEDSARSLQPHIVVLNAAEARVLAGSDRPVGDLSRRLGALAVVTDASGVTAALGDEHVTVTSPPTESPIDTTGAGDAFTAGLVSGLIEAPWPPPPGVLHAALRGAADLAAAVTRVRGAHGRVPGERPGGMSR